MAPYFPIVPKSDKPSVTYRQKLAWEIKEEDWNRPEGLRLDLKTKIPGSINMNCGGAVVLRKIKDEVTRKVEFITGWPTNVDATKIHIDAVFSIKTNGETSVVIGRDQGLQFQPRKGKIPQTIAINNTKRFTIDPTHLYDENRCFIFEAELLVVTNDPNEEDCFKRPNSFVKDMQTILNDQKNSDVLIVAVGKQFKCHKNILSARSEVFKNMLAHDTLESRRNIIELTDVPTEAVEELLKHIYTGEIPSDPENLSIEVLHLAVKYQLESLKDACSDYLIASLDVQTCISTFVMVDRYLPQDYKVREKVILFMKCKALEVVESEDWDKLIVDHPLLASELTRAVVRAKQVEKHKCQFCVVSYV